MRVPRSGKEGHGHIDRSTGRNKRDDLRWGRETAGESVKPERQNGRVVRGGRLAAARARRMRGQS